MDDQDTNASAAQALEKAVSDIRVGMLTTQDKDGRLRSRPMVCAGLDQDALWFITKEHTPKVAEAQEHEAVNVAFASPERDAYVSVSGQARVVHDPQLLQKLWKPELSRWFPEGTGDPDLALLRIDIEHAEEWHTAGTA
ncbi:MAG: pyridoxamine 5'-phosphate oxidase family protein [Verrucomicrobia bacterium]|nr:pyridoxamine 5'-phosphate oxidase family protein [Verrucomicrobiota bacterium]